MKITPKNQQETELQSLKIAKWDVNNGFSIGTPRFGRFTGHPKMAPIMDNIDTDPAKYHPKAPACQTRLKMREPWTRQKDVEEWARNLGFRNQKLLKSRKEAATNLGPAWHTVKDSYKYEPALQNVGFTRACRQPLTRSRDSFPGPGTYYTEKPYKAPYGPHSTRPTFEREHPCRFRTTHPPWFRGISTATYNDPNDIANKPNKIVSLRGPYELFSVKRDASTIISKFNYSKVTSSKTWPLDAPLSTAMPYVGLGLKSGRKRHWGRIAANDLSMCKRSEVEPGATTYNPHLNPVVKRNKYAFNSSDVRQMSSCDRSKISLPTCTHYDVVEPQLCYLKGPTSVFRSKSKRDINQFFIQKSMATF